MFLDTFSRLGHRYFSSIDLSNKLNSFPVAIFATVSLLATYPLSADVDGGESLINYQANTAGDTFVSFGPGLHGIIPPDEMEYVPENTLKLPSDFLNALEADSELEFEIVVVYQIEAEEGVAISAARCHRHAGGRTHWHRAKSFSEIEK